MDALKNTAPLLVWESGAGHFANCTNRRRQGEKTSESAPKKESEKIPTGPRFIEYILFCVDTVCDSSICHSLLCGKTFATASA